MLIVVLLFVGTGLWAGENLLPNGNFDAGKDGAEKWEKTDNLTSFWVTEKGRGRALKLDSRVDRKQALAWKEQLKNDPGAKAPVAVIPENKLLSIGAYEGATLDSDLIDVEPGQTYTLSVDVKGKYGIIVWIKGFMMHPRRKHLTDSYQTRLVPEGSEKNKWKTFSIDFNPTKRMPKTSKMKVRIFVYWPVCIAYFDNVRIEKK
ncbi:MAG: carbohydrate binding domain-containing protein [Victivallaceae bacterium]|nr:carbohydrate binding domain-containing protein [Victivallaceae bacterium]